MNATASALASTLSLLFPARPPLALHPQVIISRRAARLNSSSASPALPPWPSLSAFWASWKLAGPNTRLDADSLRVKVASFLALELFARIGDMARIPIHNELLYFIQEGACWRVILHFWSPKEAANELVRVEIAPYHQEAHLCSCCLLNLYVTRLKKRSLVSDLMVPIPSRRNLPAGQRCAPSPSLFRFLAPNTGGSASPLRPLGKQRLAKIIKSSFISRGEFPPGFKAKDVRSVASSHVFNLGCPVARVLRQGRWKRQSTFRSHYLRPLVVAEHDPAKFKSMPISSILRVRTSRPHDVPRQESARIS